MLEELLQFTATEQEAGQTIRDVLQKHYGVSRRLLVRAKYQGNITRNGVPVYVTERLQPGDRVTIAVPADEGETVQPEPMPLAIRFEDEDILVVAKPAGLVVHPTGNHVSGTLANGVVAYWQVKGEARKFRPVNRLDKDTSGLLIVAKNQWAHEQFSRMQKERTLLRTYQAIVHGRVGPDEGVVDAPIGLRNDSIITREVRPDGQSAVTRFRVLARHQETSWLELRLETGRTHQIRVHMSHLGHPLLGDDMYGGRRDYIGRQALHAVKLSFLHPRDKRQMELNEPLPEDMQEVVARFFS
ncbi:RluA family pseudouridine synthase [Brevibacillus sp. H7]|uniref:RluA family pseudouridine synthase n=1 Tax=Brevibacillus sp. H7 TaxID=3349138 RepID=UPI0038047C38